MPFTSLGLNAALLRAASSLGFATPTPVQQAAIPAVLQGRDVLATAQTGSGKTAAYALPVLQTLLDFSEHPTPPTTPTRARASTPSRLPHTLVLVPTRELAAQVGQTLYALAQHAPQRIKTAVVHGGVSINPQMMDLRGGADIVVATPGRLLDLVDHNALRLGSIATLVLDEADRLLDLGFADELREVLALLPRRRQNLMFSATFAPAIEALAHQLLHDPVRVAILAQPQLAPDITQRAIAVDAAQRTQLLRHLITTEQWPRTLVFVASQHTADRVADKLHKTGIYATSFHGKVSQGTRADILAEFKDSRWDVVVATDLAARGLHIDELPVVVNYDLPRSPIDYVHRMGRTGRAGKSGLAISFVSPATEAHFRLIEKRQGMRLPREHIAGYEPSIQENMAEMANTANIIDSPDRGNGGIKGKRPSKKDKLRAAAAKELEKRTEQAASPAEPPVPPPEPRQR
jgi:superfamily II DNA/RNA helicase